MQLKIRRSQRDSMTGSAIFCIDARVEFTPGEQKDVTRYRLNPMLIYSSEAAKRAGESGAMAMANARFQTPRHGNTSDWLDAATSSIGSGMKALAFGAVVALSLKITVGSLQKGHHIECKSLDEVLGAEDALMAACKNLTVYLEAAATFNGAEVVVDFSKGEPELVAKATSPQPVLIESSPVAPSSEIPDYAPPPELPPPMDAAPELAMTYPSAPSENALPEFSVEGLMAMFGVSDPRKLLIPLTVLLFFATIFGMALHVPLLLLIVLSAAVEFGVYKRFLS